MRQRRRVCLRRIACVARGICGICGGGRLDEGKRNESK
jgi:hypothetical protein